MTGLVVGAILGFACGWHKRDPGVPPAIGGAIGAYDGWVYDHAVVGLVTGLVVGSILGFAFAWGGRWVSAKEKAREAAASLEAQERWLPRYIAELDRAAVAAFVGDLVLGETEKQAEKRMEPFTDALMQVAQSSLAPLQATREVLASLLAAAGELSEGRAARVDLLPGRPYHDAVPVAVVVLWQGQSVTRVYVVLYEGAPGWTVTFGHTPDGTHVRSPAKERCV